MNILILTKRQYTNKDLLDDRFGRLRELPLELALKKHRVHGLCLSYIKKKEGKIRDGQVTWESLNAGTLKIPGLIRFTYRAFQLAQQADAIWACSDSFYGIIGCMLGRRFGIPVVFDLYDNFEYFLMARLPLVRQLYRRAIRKSAAVTCVSNPLARLVRSYGRKDRVFVLENAVRNDLFMPMDKLDCRKALGFPRDALLAGTAGALESNRGISSLLEAFDILKSKHPNLDLVLAGPRSMHIPRNHRIYDLGILPLDKVPLVLNALDVAIICNKENDFGRYCFPQKAVEIMACNVPLIAARVGSMGERFADHPEWLFTPDDPGDLARVLENRLTNPEVEYGGVPEWSEAGKNLESVFIELCGQ